MRVRLPNMVTVLFNENNINNGCNLIIAHVASGHNFWQSGATCYQLTFFKIDVVPCKSKEKC